MVETQLKLADRFVRVPPSRLAAIRDNWLAIGLTAASADRPRAEAGVRLAYRRAGLPDDVRLVWTSSPMSGAVVADSLARRAKGPRKVADRVRLAVSMARGVLTRVVTPALSTAIRRAVVDPLATHVTDRVWRPIHRQVVRLIRRPLSRPGFGQHDAPWLAFYDVLGQGGADVTGIEACAEIAQSCGWWWPFDDVCVLSERPSLLALDERGRLHSADGPAVLYPDGWSIHAWRGAVVDARVVLQPELITVEQVQREADPAVRRALLERYGVGRYVEDSGANASLLERWMEIGGTASAAGQPPSVEPDWITAILPGEDGGKVRGQGDTES